MAHKHPLADELATALQRMIRRSEEAVERSARHGGMHPTDFRCIAYLHNRGEPVSPKELNGYLGLSSGSGTALLDRLERAGTITRLPNPQDGRGVLVALIPEMAADALALHARMSRLYQEATQDFSEPEIVAITRYLRAVEALTDELNNDLYTDTGPTPSA